MPPSVTPKKATALSHAELIRRFIPPKIVQRLKHNVFLRISVPHLFSASSQAKLGWQTSANARKKRRARSDEEILQKTTVPKISSLLSDAPRSIRPVDMKAEPWKDPAVVFGLDYPKAYWSRKIMFYTTKIEAWHIMLTKHTIALNIYGPWEEYMKSLFGIWKKLRPTVTIVEPDLTVEKKELTIRLLHLRYVLDVAEKRVVEMKEKKMMNILDLSMSDIDLMMKAQANMMMRVVEAGIRKEEREREVKNWAKEVQRRKAKEAEERATQRKREAEEGNA